MKRSSFISLMRIVMGALTLGSVALITSATAAPIEFFVAPGGSDSNPGSEAQPFKSLEKARDAIRAATNRTTTAAVPPSGWDGANIHLRTGVHVVSSALLLDGRDGGTESRPVTIQAYGSETVVLSGGVQIPLEAWKPVSDPVVLARLSPAVRNVVRQVDLRELGVKNLGDLGVAGSRIELNIAGVLQPLTRWPSSGWTTVATLPQGTANGTVTVSDDRVKQWAPSPHIWAHGYWGRDNSDGWYPIGSVNVGTRALSLAQPWAAEGFRVGQWFEVFNVLEELDQPGEWYLDQVRLRIICVPPATGLASASVSSASSVLIADAANWIRLRGVTVENARSHGVVVRNSVGTALTDLTVRNVGGWGVRVEGGSRAILTNVTVSATGEGGVALSGGDRTTLAGSAHVIQGSRISGFARVKRTGNPGILLEGVGVRVTTTTVENGPHTGIEFRGNDHVIEDSILRRLCLETGDAGAIYSGADWSWRGTIIRRNTFEDINHTGLPNGGAQAGKPSGIYLDDHISGTTISSNTFTRCGFGVLVDGGRDNVIDANTFSGCETPIFLGEGLPSSASDAALRTALQAVPYASGTWATRYSTLVNILNDSPRSPSNNAITNNRALDKAWLLDAKVSVRAFVPTANINFSSTNASVALAQLVAFSVTPPESAFEGISFYVATTGNDSNAGSEAAPFATVARARDAIRSATGRQSSAVALGSSWKGARVILKGGAYASSSVITFDARDGGTEAFPVTYRAETGATVIITSAATVPDSAWKLIAQQADDTFAWSRLPAASRGKVYRLDVGALGVDKGSIDATAGGVTNWLMPIVNGRLRQMARWPNGPILEAAGWRIIDATNVDGGTAGDSRITINSATPASWDRASQELLAYGHWAHDWSSHWQTIKDIVANGSGGSQVTIGPRDWTWPMGGDPQRKIFFANMVQMLDQEGSYVWNHSRGILYYLPVSGEGPPSNCSLTQSHAVIQNGPRWPGDPANTADWLTLKDLVIEGARERLLHVQHSVGMVLSNCILRNGGGDGVNFRFGYKNRVIGGSVTNVVASAVLMRGMGDLPAYRDGECVIDGVTIDACGWFSYGGVSGINLGSNWNTRASSGVVVRNCTLRNLPGVGVTFTAARITLENNLFERVVQIDGDAGAAYAGGRITHRGNTVRGNTFRSITRHPSVHQSWGGIAGVYVDDSFSGVTVEDNVFDVCDNGLFFMSGKDNVARRNTFSNCEKGHLAAPIYLGSRVGWGQEKIDEDLASVPVDQEPWKTLFPDLVKLRSGGALWETRMRPTGNVIADNLTTTGNVLVKVSGSVASDHDASQLNYAINDTGAGSRKPLSQLWVVD